MQPIDGTGAVSSRLAKVSVSHQSLALALVLSAGALLLFAGLGNRDFWPPDEPRYGAIAEELRSFVHGWRGLVLLHLNGAVYTQKPPLFFWLAALGGAPFGRVSEAAARLPSALAGFGTLLLVAGLGRSMFRARSGALAAAVLLTLPSWLQLARSARLDALLTVFVTLAFAAAWRIDREIGDARRGRLLLHAALGLGVLTKGPVALLLPLLGVVAYLGWERRLAELRRFVSAEGLLLSVAPGLVWLAGATLLAPPGYANASFWDNLILRFFSGTAHERPVWFYLEALPRGFLPWTLLWPAAWWRQRAILRDAARAAEARAWRFLLASIGAAFVFLSLSAGKRGLYLLPVYPLLAIACGEALAAWLDEGDVAPRWLRRSLAASAVAVVLAGLGSLVFDRVAEVAAAGLVRSAARGRRGGRAARGARAAPAHHAAQRARRRRIGRAPLRRAGGPRLPLPGAECAQLAARGRGDRAGRDPSGRRARRLPQRHPGRRRRVLRAPPGARAARAREVAAFFAEGGGAVVIEDEHLEELGRTPPLRELGRGRSRQRRLHVMAPAD